ncbi:MAG: hypothetical protein ACOC1F_08585 [Myxococcota bacterium]
MNPRDLVQAVMRGDDLAARQWVKDAKRAGMDFSEVEDPGLAGDERVVAAALFELLAERQGKRPASWTTTAGSATKPVFLLKDAETSPAMRRLSERGTPPSMRARNVFALRDYLNVL